jgi:hypothetical protein
MLKMLTTSFIRNVYESRSQSYISSSGKIILIHDKILFKYLMKQKHVIQKNMLNNIIVNRNRNLIACSFFNIL